MHGGTQAVAEAFMAGLALLTPEQGPTYYENAYSMSPTAIRHILEELVSTTAWPVHSPFAREHFGRGKAEGLAEGKAAGEAEAVLLVLQARGLDITADDRRRITGCADLAQLKTWVARAATVQSTSELFD
jgi:ribosomal protein L13E